MPTEAGITPSKRTLASGPVPGDPFETGTWGTFGRQPLRYVTLALYSVCLCFSGAYLYKLARWTEAQGIGWIGPGVLRTILVIAGILLVIQLFRALLKRRFLHILFLLLIAGCFIPAYLTLHLPLERFHFLEYGILGVLIFWSLKPRRYFLQFYLLSLNILLVVSFFDEIFQGFVPERIYDIHDISINIFSGMIGILAVRMMDLEAPLPLHPHHREEHVAPDEPPPLIDLHIFGSDLFFVLPLLCILALNLFLIHAHEAKDFQGVWQDPLRKEYTLSLYEDGRVLVDFPWCKLFCRFDLEGNRLDGFRLSLGIYGDPEDLSPPCREALEGRFRIHRSKEDRFSLSRKDLGTFYRISEASGDVGSSESRGAFSEGIPSSSRRGKRSLENRSLYCRILPTPSGLIRRRVPALPVVR